MQLFRRKSELSPKEIIQFCEKNHAKNVVLNSDGTVDVEWFYLITPVSNNVLPCQFNKIATDFNVSGNKLKSLKGSPIEVGRDFDCSGNLIVDLDFSPRKVDGSFKCGISKNSYL